MSQKVHTLPDFSRACKEWRIEKSANWKSVGNVTKYEVKRLAKYSHISFWPTKLNFDSAFVDASLNMQAA
jgi:hypothetical protein